MRKFRTTVHFMLGNLNNFAETDVVDYALLSHIDKYMLYELYHFTKFVETAYDEFVFIRGECCLVLLDLAYFSSSKL